MFSCCFPKKESEYTVNNPSYLLTKSAFTQSPLVMSSLDTPIRTPGSVASMGRFQTPGSIASSAGFYTPQMYSSPDFMLSPDVQNSIASPAPLLSKL
ncbi:hypothetical protein RCL1_008414 [Eukaryota sp. TZLM3-RCL]